MDIQSFRELFGKNLKRIRKARGLTQSAAAEAVGLETHNWNRIENGKSFPQPQTLVNIVNFFNISPTELFMPTDDNGRIIAGILEILHNNPARLDEFYKILLVLTKQ